MPNPALTLPRADAPVDWRERTDWVKTSDGHELALRTVEAPQLAGARPALLMLHGLFSDGRFFLNARHEGPGRHFLDRGHRIHIGELRAHGQSRWPSGRRQWNWGFDELVRHDLPALIEAVTERETGPVFVVAHSIAGYALLASLGCQTLLQQRLGGVCLLSSAVNDYSELGWRKRAAFHASALIARSMGRFPAKALGVGVSDEPPALIRQFVRWAPTHGFFGDDGTDYWQALGQVKVPVFAGVGSADRFHASVASGQRLVAALGSADRTFVELGPRNGLRRDYGHVDVLRGAGARTEVLPRLAEWIDHRTVTPSGD